ncbi:MAG TPA: LytR C-terminal domain-containing protein [Microthrixaceae bacterium]|nr:LytR C-terminal domain-containing protein [Microthrixaceae bacterium]
MSGSPPGTTEVRPVVRRRVAHRRRRLRRLTLAQAGFTLIAAVVLVALVWVGWRSAMRITGGRDELVTDPAAPGYVGEVLPTDVTLLAVTGDGGELISMLVLVDDEGASGLTAVPMSPHLVLAGFEDGPAEAASSVFADGGIDVLQLRLGADLGFGSTDALVVPGAVLVELVRSVGPLTVHLADDVFEAPVDADPEDATLRYPAGEAVLEPEVVDDFLALSGYRELDPNRALRAGALWTAMLDAFSEGVPPVTPFGDAGDPERLATLLEAMATQRPEFRSIPMTPMQLSADPPVTLHRIDTEAMADWVASHVPFPSAAFPGQFATTAVLDGTGTEGAVRTVAPRVVRAGAQILLSGNADAFDVESTRVEYSREEVRPAAERIAEALGAEVVSVEGGRPDVDVTVVVGKDLLA